jgi:hypothetical protein
MHTLFIVFVSFVSYAFGVVTSQRWRGRKSLGAVHPLELLSALLVVLLGVFLRMPHYSLGYLALCIVAMFFIGSVVGGMMFLGKKRGTAGTREYEEEPRDVANLRVWKRWLNFSRAVADYEFRLLLLACYLLVVGPFAILFRLGRAKNALQSAESGWMPRSDEFSLNSCRRPF